MKLAITTKTIKGFAWSLYGTGGTFMAKILVVAVLARLISVEDFGLFQAALVVIGFAEVFSDLGIGQALIRLEKINQWHVSTSYTLTLLMGLSFCGIFYLLAPWIAAFFEMPSLVPLIRVMSLLFPIKASSVISEKLLERELNFRKIANIDILSYLLGYTTTAILFAFLGYGVWALIIAIFVQFSLRAVLLFIRQPHPISMAVSRSAFRDLFAFGTGVTSIRIINYFALNGDNFVIGKMLGAGALGIYGRAYNLMSTPINRLGASFSRVLFPAMSKKQQEPAKLKKAFLVSTAAMAFVFIPASIFCWLLAPEIIDVFLGDKWQSAVLPFQILVLAMLFRIGYKVGNSLGMATGHVLQVMYRHLIYAIAIIGFSLLGVQLAGIEGACVGVVAALFIQYALSVFQSLMLLRNTRFSEFLQVLVSPLLFSCLLGLLLGGLITLCRMLVDNSFFTLVVSVLASGGCVYLMLMILPSFVLGPYGHWIFHQILSFVPDRFTLFSPAKQRMDHYLSHENKRIMH
jgi:PST family polysaccharide transporter